MWSPTHNGILLSHNKNEITPSAVTGKDLEVLTLRKVSQRQIREIACMWDLNQGYRWAYRTETVTDVENRLTVTEGEERRGKQSWADPCPAGLGSAARSCPTLAAPSTYPPAPLSMEFSRHEYWSGLPLPSPGDLPDPGTETTTAVSPALAGGFLTPEPPGKPTYTRCYMY